jgi:hypothetical protein
MTESLWLWVGFYVFVLATLALLRPRKAIIPTIVPKPNQA